MNEGFPPLPLANPESRPRRKEDGRSVPLPKELLARRAEIAQVLRLKIGQLARHLKSLSDDERKAVFYQLENEIPIRLENLAGTDLKPIAQPSPEVVYAVPKGDNLNKLRKKVDEFAVAAVKNQHVPNEWLAYLKDVREADPKDRLSGDLRRRYNSVIKRASLVCEIEFLSLKAGKNQQRDEIDGWIKDLRREFASGVQGHFFEHDLAPPTCRAVIRCTGAMFDRLVKEPTWIERIRWIESRPRFQTYSEVLSNFKVQDLAPLPAPPPGASAICIVDSGVTAGNPFLENVVRRGLVRSFLKSAPHNPNDEHGHGSAVASLASYYALNLAEGAKNRPRIWIASARILDENNQIEDERLFSKILEDVVTSFVKKGIRIFCLAVGDARKIWADDTRQILPRKSWVARRIDQLSREYDVLFVTCTGNIDLPDLNELLHNGEAYPDYLATDSAKLLDPGQAALAVTVGSSAAGTKIVAGKDSAIALRNQPSPFTRAGPGIRGEIKPEVVDYGGNLALDGSANRVRENMGLQIAAASRQLSPAISHWTGTSFAAPRVAHRLAIIDQDLRSVGVIPSACLLKAFLVNSADHRQDNGELDSIRHAFSDSDRDRLHWIIGYGLPDHVRATACDDYSTILYFQGEIEPDNVMFFDVPVPPDLCRSRDARLLTVTVVHAPEVQRWGLERYFGADLKWRMFRGDKSRDEIVLAMSEPVDESDEETLADLFPADDDDPVLPKELKFRPSFQTRSRGAVQHAAFHWTNHRKEYSDGHYTLAIAAHKRWARKVDKIPLAIVVRLEDLGRQVQIYSKVRTTIEVEI